MPWCEECAKYWTPSAMRVDGTCPRCGGAVEEQQARRMRPEDVRLSDLAGSSSPADDDRAPWHFKLLVVALVAYLGWRFVEIFT